MALVSLAWMQLAFAGHQFELRELRDVRGPNFSAIEGAVEIRQDGEYVGAYIGELHQSHLDDVVHILTLLDNGEISKDEARGAFDLL